MKRLFPFICVSCIVFSYPASAQVVSPAKRAQALYDAEIADKDFEGAHQIASEFLRDHPNNRWALIATGKTACIIGDYSLGQRLLSKIDMSTMPEAARTDISNTLKICTSARPTRPASQRRGNRQKITV